MKAAVRGLLFALILMLAASTLMASGAVGIYAIVSKVVFEPDDKTPERMQIWGAFTFFEGSAGSGGKTLTPRRGYLYFELPSAAGNPYQRRLALQEWADFKAIANTGQAVAFGRFFYLRGFSEDMISRTAGIPSDVYIGGGADNPGMAHAENPIRGESTAPTAPIPYPLNMGLTKLSITGNLAEVVKQLQDALKK